MTPQQKKDRDTLRAAIAEAIGAGAKNLTAMKRVLKTTQSGEPPTSYQLRMVNACRVRLGLPRVSLPVFDREKRRVFFERRSQTINSEHATLVASRPLSPPTRIVLTSLALLILLLTGCGQVPAADFCSTATQGTPCSARVVVTSWASGFTPEEDAAIRSGAAMWEAATGGAVAFEWMPQGRVQFRRGPVAYDMLGVTEGDAITIDAGNVPPGVGLSGVAAHELGHVLGVPHSSDQNALMYGTVHGCMRVTNGDVSALLEHWRKNGVP